MEYDILEFTKQLYDEGMFNEYSKDHFLIKALNGNLDYFDKYSNLVVPGSLIFDEQSNVENFLNNFSVRFKSFYDTFDKNEMKEFIETQLSAGKKNYDEAQFIRALSEINVINFIKCLGPRYKSAIYEPKLNKKIYY